MLSCRRMFAFLDNLYIELLNLFRFYRRFHARLEGQNGSDVERKERNVFHSLLAVHTVYACVRLCESIVNAERSE